MKKSNPLNIMGNPQRVNVTASCGAKPCACGNISVYEDGTVICGMTGEVFAPEVTDTELFAMRKAFDARNGITPAQRLIIPVALANGFKARI